MNIFKAGEFPVAMGIARRSEPGGFERNFHPELEFHLVRHGAVKYSIGEHEYPCQSNSVLITHADEPHQYLSKGVCLDKLMTLIFSPMILAEREIAQAALKGLESIHHLILSDRQANIAEFLLNEINTECRNRDLHWKEIVADHIETFLAMLHRVAQQKKYVPEVTDPFVRDVVKYLECRFTEKSSLSQVAKHFNVSRFTLSKKFNHHMGLGFREYLIQRRILAARRLLEQTDKKVANIATECGFVSLTSFNRDFRNLACVTPAAYRKVSGGSETS
jgi:AraC-like DNA-binding protein